MSTSHAKSQVDKLTWLLPINVTVKWLIAKLDNLDNLIFFSFILSKLSFGWVLHTVMFESFDWKRSLGEHDGAILEHLQRQIYLCMKKFCEGSAFEQHFSILDTDKNSSISAFWYDERHFFVVARISQQCILWKDNCVCRWLRERPPFTENVIAIRSFGVIKCIVHAKLFSTHVMHSGQSM